MTSRSAIAVLALIAVLGAGCAGRHGSSTLLPDAQQAPSGDTTEADALEGSSWRLEDLCGSGAIPGAEATIEFGRDGGFAGRGSCNRFFGKAQISGESISFGDISSTRMACPEPVANQETRYFQALKDAERYTVDGATLLIHVKGMEKSLRFARTKP